MTSKERRRANRRKKHEREAIFPTFPVDAFPPAIRDYVLAVAETTQTPVDMAATAALAVLALCQQGKYRIKGKDDWIEPLNLFTVIVAESSERKSVPTAVSTTEEKSPPPVPNGFVPHTIPTAKLSAPPSRFRKIP